VCSSLTFPYFVTVFPPDAFISAPSMPLLQCLWPMLLPLHCFIVLTSYHSPELFLPLSFLLLLRFRLPLLGRWFMSYHAPASFCLSPCSFPGCIERRHLTFLKSLPGALFRSMCFVLCISFCVLCFVLCCCVLFLFFFLFYFVCFNFVFLVLLFLFL
jgi:hypothetical protein